MRSSTTSSFRAHFANLLPEIQDVARKNYKIWLLNPRHLSLHFKKVGNYWSIRVGDNFRALAREHNGTFYWFWIGSHDAYQRLLKG